MLLFLKSSVGKKILMAVTGVIMVLFVVVHVLGNFTIFFRWINNYAEHLHALPALIWAFRLFMLAVLSLHIYLGINLTLENLGTRPQAYAVKTSQRTTFAAKYMIWTGGVVAAFIIYHLLHFTVQVIYPELGARATLDAAGRPDVFRMVVLNFQSFFVSAIYVTAMVALLLHLIHGIQSAVQTFGLNDDQSLPIMRKSSSVAAVILFLGYVSVPILILVRIVTL